MPAAFASDLGLLADKGNRRSIALVTFSAKVLRRTPSTFGGFAPVIAKLYFISKPKGGLHKPEKGSSIPNMMPNTMFDYVLSMLETTKGQWPTVAAGAGMSKRTIEKIARGEIKDPGVSQVQKLADYFHATEDRRTTERREKVA